MSHPVRPDVTAEQARDARAAAWSFAFDCFARKKAVEPAPEPDGHNDTKEWKHGYAPAVAYLGAVERVLERLYG